MTDRGEETMDKKMIFLDIDGTILMPGEGIRQTVKDGLQRARARGHQIFISTGRSVCTLPEELKDMELDGIVASAGSDIWVHGRNIYRTSLGRECIRRISGILEGMEVVYVLEGFEKIYVSPKGGQILNGGMEVPDDNPELVRWKTFFGQRKNLGNMEDWQREQALIPKVAFMTWSRTEAENVQRELAEEFHVAFFPSRTEHFFNGELISRKADKGTAILRTADYLGLDYRDTVAFGDSMNDYQMIEQAACGVVMANGDERLKQIADRVCESVAEDGVLRELERMGVL